MQVVEDQHERLRARELLEHRAHGAVQAVALLPLGRDTGERGEDVAELCARVVVERGEATWVEPVQVLVERIDEDPERQVGLELGRAARQDQAALRVGAGLERAQQPRLADPRLAGDRDGSEAAPGRVQRLIKRRQLGAAPDERRRGARHP